MQLPKRQVPVVAAAPVRPPRPPARQEPSRRLEAIRQAAKEEEELRSQARREKEVSTFL